MFDTTSSNEEPGTADQATPAASTPLDGVIQRLFAVGLTVQSVAATLRDDDRGARLAGAVESIDMTIRDVRTHLERTITAESPAIAQTEVTQP